ncbi:aminotransferase class V-fold PLP-dependent enzyme [Chloroflexia bacterium SDU3-3]|nr:aminotransferase class V-fold PLP-dependent enzyme [Chloroflexia bacterium SDU3-3]
MSSHATSAASFDLSAQVTGHDNQVPLLDGSCTRPINFDHAASTPALRSVHETVNKFLSWYSSVHRGTGFSSQISTAAFENARTIVGGFVSARPDQHVVIFGANTTWAINKLARRLAFRPGEVVITSELEHHADDLPWRQVARVAYIRVDERGQLDEDHLAYLLKQHERRVKLVAISGGSNVTGTLPNIHRIAEQAHAAGARIAVDCAQLAPHRAIDIGDLDDPAHLDYVSLSAHKLYAPFGTGVLIGRRDTFANGTPETVGGGTIKVVTPSDIIWADAPARDEAGTPNVVGAVALAAAVQALERIGMDNVAAHEAALTAALLERLPEVPGIKIFGDTDPANAASRLGVVPFQIEGVDHRLIGAVLSSEYGIAVRSGAFCAQPYLRRLLNLSDDELSCEPTSKPVGLVRASVGLANTLEDVDALVAALHTIARGEHRGTYELDTHEGVFRAQGWQPRLEDYFDLFAA